jgi:hypothetical protein
VEREYVEWGGWDVWQHWLASAELYVEICDRRMTGFLQRATMMWRLRADSS